MSVQIPLGIRDAIRSIDGVVALVALMSVVGGCDTAADPRPVVAPAAGLAAVREPRNPRPRSQLLLTAKPRAKAAEAEAFLKAKVLPSLVRDHRIGDVTTFVDGRTGSYVAQIELRTPSPPQLSLAIDVLSVGRSREEARQIIADLANYFDASSARVLPRRPDGLTPRVDLSLSRSRLGTVEGAKR
jgi:hypothetical protein